METTLIIKLERALAILKSAIKLVIRETALPAYLLEGILLNLLAEIRAQKAAEIAAEYEDALKQIPSPDSIPADQTDTDTERKETN